MDKIRFEELNCSEEIKKAVKDMGFEEATPIQTMAIPLVLQGKDVVGQAQTGTGKTAAFAIPAIDMVDSDKKETQALILCPTRELAVQVAEELAKIAKYKRGIRTLPIFGGQPIDRQIKGLKRGVQIVIGTPGRVMDHMRRKTLKLENLKMMILDEADEMLNMGFREDIETILESVGEERQTLLFSATMPKPIMEIIHKYQKNPEIVKVVHKELTTPNINQLYLEVREKDKLEVLTRLIDMYSPKLSLVFCNTKRKVDDITDLLQSRGYATDKIHGDMKQSKRIQVMDKFKRGDVEILVATDVAARGLDIDDVESVFNYDMPTHEEYYVHRIGRTGRAGRTGSAFTFVTGRDFYLLRNIMKYTKKKIKKHPIPTISDIETIKTSIFLEKLKKKINEGKLEKYIKVLDDLIEDDFSAIEVAAALLKMELEMKYAKEVDIKPDKPYKGTNAKEEGMVRMFINIGKNKKIRPQDVVGAIAGETSISGKRIGDIDIHENYTFVEIPEEYADEVLSIMSKNTIKGNKINIEPATGKKSKGKKKKKNIERKATRDKGRKVKLKKK
ncbi:DEAD/DEAH box helicase [Paramaledivibacter caminithermalis]|uniref:ATP-dependent RNA helicase CshA n=1 Tax=Paramaledivibacter caminithermalis (strain DSM 15212 / CIP 107654 / DViRD3) TaxID=1121301 RepID=A0A1M6KRE4_PARC5|nr:DEAD/DEAH box helicase [Paramaledivibacter caminithermalis]SHJ61450.1 ATP-dependent RNA helicase DeaD [Paramaledivibacter caminithermalis DSM 15212]